MSFTVEAQAIQDPVLVRHFLRLKRAVDDLEARLGAAEATIVDHESRLEVLEP